MMPGLVLFIFLVAVPGMVQVVQLFGVLVSGKYVLQGGFRVAADLATLIVLPGVFLANYDWELPNDCCAMDSAFFSPAYRGYAYCALALSVAGYLYALLRKSVDPPLPEVLLQLTLLFGLGFSVLVTVHVNDPMMAFLGAVPVNTMFLGMLVSQHLLHLKQLEKVPMSETGWSGRLAGLLSWPWWAKYPVLIALLLPILALLSGILLLFGQQPDALMKAFTDTYRHGLSRLSCADVVCPDEHYLCTVASKGHHRLVRPLRPGIRHGRPILVNRQLLVANAFEQVIQERWPATHTVIRKHYDRYGFRFRKACLMLGSPWISDVVYLAMKPLEWTFVLFLYCAVTDPERRISRQYSPLD